MTLSDDATLLFYLIVLAVVIGSLVFGDFRNRFTQSIQHALVWLAIFLGVVALYGAKDTIVAQLRPINGEDVDFIVDTGATSIVLTKEDALRVGVDPASLNFFGRAETANGVVRTAAVRLEHVAFAGQIDRNLRASVNGGNLQSSLLGMTYLSRFSKLEIEGSELRLTP